MIGVKGFQKGHPNYNKKNSIKALCHECNSEIEINHHDLKWQRHFCNHICYAKNMIGHKMTENNRQAINKVITGKPRSDITKFKISVANKGSNNGNWLGGVKKGRSAYGYLFTEELKEKIKQRDNHTCQLCNKSNTFLNVHHIDYNKLNNKESNLITLCHSCHAKTNIKNREQWKSFLSGILFQKYKNLYQNEMEVILYDRHKEMQIH